VVDDAIDATAPQTSSRIVLYNDVPRDVKIDADREHIFRILTNLMRNAIEALEQHFTATSGEDGEARIKAWREGSVVVIEVSDNGPGVSDKARAHLFEAFQGSVKAGGTGLGLAIAADLARAHGGKIELKDQPGGARFWVFIPDRVADISTGRRGEREAS